MIVEAGRGPCGLPILVDPPNHSHVSAIWSALIHPSDTLSPYGSAWFSCRRNWPDSPARPLWISADSRPDRVLGPRDRSCPVVSGRRAFPKLGSMPFAPSFAVMFRTRDNVRIDAAHTPSRGRTTSGSCWPTASPDRCRERSTRRIAHVLSGFGGVISFDFRGHGRSGGESTVGDLEILDMDAAVRHARAIGYTRVALVGFSMGGAVAVRHAGVLGGVDAVASVSAPARWYYRGTRPMRQVHWAIERPLGRWVTKVGKRTRIMKGVWDPLPLAPYEAAAKISPTPLLVVHGDADALLPARSPLPDLRGRPGAQGAVDRARVRPRGVGRHAGADPPGRGMGHHQILISRIFTLQAGETSPARRRTRRTTGVAHRCSTPDLPR